MVYNILSLELFRRRDRIGCLAETVKSLSLSLFAPTHIHKYIIHLSCPYATALVGTTVPDGDGRLVETYSGVKFALNYIGGPPCEFFTVRIFSGRRPSTSCWPLDGYLCRILIIRGWSNTLFQKFQLTNKLLTGIFLERFLVYDIW